MTESTDEVRAWSSGLSTKDFAAGEEAGLEPLGFVQGCSVISWNWYSGGSTLTGFGPTASTRSGYYEEFRCPHGFVSMEHRMYGANYEQSWVNEAWRGGYNAALQRLVEEATGLGAHGVIGILDRSARRNEIGAHEFTLQGTAVRIPGADAPPRPFTTTLAGQKLIKLLEAGFVPVSLAATLVGVQVYASCVTEILLGGAGGYAWGMQVGGEIDQVSRAHAGARELARRQIRAQLGGDTLHAARCTSTVHEIGGLGPAIEVSISGNRVRRFKDFDPIPLPRPVVRLVD